MLKGIKGAIFDLDGTLIDSMWLWTKIDIEYLERHGFPFEREMQREIEGMTFQETAVYFKNRYHLTESLEQIQNDWHQMALQKYRTEVALKPGARELLEYLNRSGIPVGLATSNSTELADAALDAHQIRSCFTSIRTAAEAGRGKPAPDIYLLVASDLACRPADCLVFEDIPMGILAGRNAGMTVCAVADPNSEDCREEKIRLADYYLESLEELRPEFTAPAAAENAL